MKRVIDSVHGEILIGRKYFAGIIDTPEFQRLRHIDQSAIRSVFPCARHDRFVHSLGVFYVGSKIARHLEQQLFNKKVDEKIIHRIIESYKIACLLHDVGHAPFSHTFEKYFGEKKVLSKILNEHIPGIVREGEENAPNYHEYTSAIIAVSRFHKAIELLEGEVQLVARMITGLKYQEKDKSLENCFIELLHGNIIDADRIDYACRDVWASGYATANFDLNRLIHAIILDDETGLWEIIYKSSVINEIESLLKIRGFQNRNVIGHHTVVYDQHLLLKAVEDTAIRLMKSLERENESTTEQSKDSDKAEIPKSGYFDITTYGDSAVSRICSLQNLTGDGEYPYLSDADLMHLMKKDRENKIAEQWFSRNYIHIPLWKTKIEFNLYFPFFKDYSLDSIDFEGIFKSVMETCGITNYLLYKVPIKGDVDLSSVKVQIGTDKAEISNVIYQKELTPDKNFYFAYLPKNTGIECLTIIKALEEPLRNSITEFEKEKNVMELEEMRKTLNEKYGIEYSNIPIPTEK